MHVCIDCKIYVRARRGLHINHAPFTDLPAPSAARIHAGYFAGLALQIPVILQFKSPQAEGVAGLADACLLVVRQNAAVAPALNKAIESLEKQNAKMLGCVLNNVYASRMLDGSGYGYGYGGYHRYNRYGGYGSKNVRK